MISDELLKKKKIKITNQRKQILGYLLAKKRVTMKEIIRDNQEIDQSTIYRIIELFEEKKLILKIIQHHDAYYLVNNDDHKHYIECINCHDLTEIDVCPYNLIDLKGYKIKTDETIKGICKQCQQHDEKIGIFVGSFNPITNAHLEIGKTLYDQKILDKIIYVPCNSLKKEELIDIHDRYQMIVKAIEPYKYLAVNDIEIRNGKDNFSYKELDLLKKEYVKKLYIILGADNLLNLDKWDNYQYLLENYYFIIINRFNLEANNIIKEKYHDYCNKFMVVNYQNDLSSTFIRKQIKNCQNINASIDENVLLYIKENHLYK